MDKELRAAELDWSAPIMPGVSMMGLTIGLTRQEVWEALQENKIDESGAGEDFVVQFRNSQKFIVDELPDAIILRDVVSQAPDLGTFDEHFVIAFRNNVLVHLMTSMVYGAQLEYYKGKIFGDVGLGTLVSELEKHCEIEFDSGDELFYSNNQQCKGLSIGGSCSSLEDDPEQTVSYIRIYKS